jgi:hypothetical protein
MDGGIHVLGVGMWVGRGVQAGTLVGEWVGAWAGEAVIMEVLIGLVTIMDTITDIGMVIMQETITTVTIKTAIITDIEEILLQVIQVMEMEPDQVVHQLLL